MRISFLDWRWVVIWCLIYVSFLALDILVPGFVGTSLLKYAGIFLCLVYSYRRSRGDYLLSIALLFTFLADTVLIWTGQFVFGIFVFCFAQFFHIARLARTAPRFLAIYYLMLVSVFLFALARGVAPIYAIAFAYGMSLLANIAFSAAWWRREPRNQNALAACLGFLLFLLCDVCVGMQFLSTEGVFAAAVYPVVTFLVWLFYFPAQILISNSSTLKTKE